MLEKRHSFFLKKKKEKLCDFPKNFFFNNQVFFVTTMFPIEYSDVRSNMVNFLLTKMELTVTDIDYISMLLYCIKLSKGSTYLLNTRKTDFLKKFV